MSAVAFPPVRSLLLHSAVDVCAFVDDLETDEAGELAFVGEDDAPDGVVFVENGHVCWAAARGLARRLSHLLAEPAHVEPAVMESLYRTCKQQGAPLGEYLVNKGLVSAADLRCALLKHTAESLHALCGPDTQVEWCARRRGGYSPRFTFTTTELLPRTLAEAHRGLAERTSAELADAFTGGDWGAAFVRSSSRGAPDPIAIQGPCPEKIEVLLNLGRWASSSLDVTGLLHDEQAFLATLVDGGACVAWRSGAAILTGWTSVHGPARLLNRRARARRKDAPDGHF